MKRVLLLLTIVVTIGCQVMFYDGFGAVGAQSPTSSDKSSDKSDGKSSDKSPGKISDPLSTATFGGLKFRSIGPGVTGGRIVDFAVDPIDRAKYFVAVAAGGVWKTVNAGTTWTPVFDNYGSYSIGALALDQKDPSVLWVGTGELNSQRSVGYGDGLYKSEDGGRSFRKIGLGKSEHIGKLQEILQDLRSISLVNMPDNLFECLIQHEVCLSWNFLCVPPIPHLPVSKKKFTLVLGI